MNVDDYAEIATIVRHHHERVDGRGYPDNLTGEQIPIVSRIIAVADACNAMTSDRACSTRCHHGLHACVLRRRLRRNSTRLS